LSDRIKVDAELICRLEAAKQRGHDRFTPSLNKIGRFGAGLLS
jgi:hypothetical protein